jgi:hypothetical protein
MSHVLIQFHSRGPDVSPRLRNNNKVRDHAIDLDIFDNGVWEAGVIGPLFANLYIM